MSYIENEENNAIVNTEPHDSEVAPSLVAEGGKQYGEELSANPKGFGYTKQFFVSELPVTGIPDAIYLIQQSDGKYNGFAWNIAYQRFDKVYSGAIPQFKGADGERATPVREVVAPKESVEKIFKGAVAFEGDVYYKGQLLGQDEKGGEGLKIYEISATTNLAQLVANYPMPCIAHTFGRYVAIDIKHNLNPEKYTGEFESLSGPQRYVIDTDQNLSLGVIFNDPIYRKDYLVEGDSTYGPVEIEYGEFVNNQVSLTVPAIQVRKLATNEVGYIKLFSESTPTKTINLFRTGIPLYSSESLKLVFSGIVDEDGTDPILYTAIFTSTTATLYRSYFVNPDGSYANLYAGNLLTDQNWRWVNNFAFDTGTVDTVFDGEATLYAIRGKSLYSNGTFHYVNVVNNKSVIFNLYNPTLHYAHVVESDNENNGLCVSGTGITANTIMEFDEDSSFATPTEIALTEETNSEGIPYLSLIVPTDGYLRVKNAEPADLCIANVWGGNRVNHHPAYEEAVVNINSATYFPTGMKSIAVNDEDVVYDELYANKYYVRVSAYDFGATPTVSYVSASGTYNIYRMALTNAFNKGACQIGGSTKFAWVDVGQMSSSTPISADCMSLYTGYIYFAIAQSEDTTYTYTEDSAVVDAESFATELADKGHLYTESGGVYTEATEYTSDTTYYYISATNLHGLNGKAITDEIANKTVVYQIASMDKTDYTGTTISPALNWSYHMGDFGTEELTLADGYVVVPNWVVYYPINALETIQQLPNNYVSLESAENLLHQVGDLQGFDFDSISVDEETGNMKVNGLVDTKETIVSLETILQNVSDSQIINENDIQSLEKTKTAIMQKNLVNVDFYFVSAGHKFISQIVTSYDEGNIFVVSTCFSSRFYIIIFTRRTGVWYYSSYKMIS